MTFVLQYKFFKISFRELKVLRALFISSMLSAALSTASSIIAVISSTSRTDLIRGTRFEDWLFIKMPFLRTNFNRLLSLLSGIVCYVCAVGIAALGSTVIKLAMTNFGVCGGPILGLFCLSFVEESKGKVQTINLYFSDFALDKQ